MKKLCVIFLILSSGCASKPKPVQFNGKWATCEVVPEEKWQCLSKEDVKELREVLVNCIERNK